MSPKAAKRSPRIHPTAIVADGARLEAGVEVGPYAVIGPDVRLGADTKVAAHVVLAGDTEIGERCEISPAVCIGMPAQDKKSAGIKGKIRIGDENVIREYVTIHGSTDESRVTQIGHRNYFMVASHVGHDCQIGDDIVMANSAALGGHVRVDDHAVIGGLVGVHQFVRIGAYSMIGALAKIVSDVPPYSLVEGHPAMIRGVNAVGLKRASYPASEITEIRRALKILFLSGLGLQNARERAKVECPPTVGVLRLLEFLDGSKRGMMRGRARSLGESE